MHKLQGRQFVEMVAVGHRKRCFRLGRLRCEGTKQEDREFRAKQSDPIGKD